MNSCRACGIPTLGMWCKSCAANVIIPCKHEHRQWTGTMTYCNDCGHVLGRAAILAKQQAEV